MLSFVLPSVLNRDDATSVDTDALPSGLGHVKVLSGRVAPAAIIGWPGPVGWAQVRGGDDDGAGIGPTPLVLDCTVTLDLKARSADQTTVEESLTGGSCGGAIPLAVQVPVSTCTRCT